MANEQDIQYEVRIWTSDIRGAGTDSDVFIQFYGTGGQTEKIGLADDSNNFEKGKLDSFLISAPDVGRITKIRIGHNGENLMSGWHLQKVCVRQLHTNNEYWFIVNRWFDTSEDDNRIERDLEPTNETGNPIIFSAEDGQKTSMTEVDSKDQNERNNDEETKSAGQPLSTDNMQPSKTPTDKSRASNTSADKSRVSNTPADKSRVSNTPANMGTLYTPTERTNNKDDPFYVPSAYDKDPKAELDSIRSHKISSLPKASYSYKKNKLASVNSRKSQMSTANNQAMWSPIQEEKSQSLIEVHTEDQQYMTNDFNQNEINENRGPSGLSIYMQKEDGDKAVASIKRTLQLLY